VHFKLRPIITAGFRRCHDPGRQRPLGLPDESGSGKGVTLRASANAAVAPQQCCPDVYLEGDDHTTLIHISQAQFTRLMSGARHGRFSVHD
jgi:hypothetical protein